MARTKITTAPGKSLPFRSAIIGRKPLRWGVLAAGAHSPRTRRRTLLLATPPPVQLCPSGSGSSTRSSSSSPSPFLPHTAPPLIPTPPQPARHRPRSMWRRGKSRESSTSLRRRGESLACCSRPSSPCWWSWASFTSARGGRRGFDRRTGLLSALVFDSSLRSADERVQFCNGTRSKAALSRNRQIEPRTRGWWLSTCHVAAPPGL